jgi:hypothetical protein
MGIVREGTLSGGRFSKTLRQTILGCKSTFSVQKL